METQIPQFIKPFLWSYNTSALDMQKHKQRIITNVLNYGNSEATDWLRSQYSKDEIKEVLRHPFAGEWTKRSYNFWSLIYGESFTLKPRVIYSEKLLPKKEVDLETVKKFLVEEVKKYMK